MKKHKTAVADINVATWHFTANSPEDLANIGDTLITARRPAFRFEQWQMSRLLESLSKTPLFTFPIRVRHTGERGTPDFQIESGGQRIAAELAMITSQDVELARSLQRNGRLKRTLQLSNLYRNNSRPRTITEVIQEGFAHQPMVFPESAKERSEIWINEMIVQLDEKTNILRERQFEHGDEDWLVLWDRIRTPESEIESRIKLLTTVLASRWRPSWYARVLIQQTDYYPYVALFNAAGFRTILNSARAQNNYPHGFEFSGSPEE